MSELDPISDASPELAEWLRTHPDPIVLRATFRFPALPATMVAEQRISDWPCDQAGRPWPADRHGRPWARDRWGNPSRPLDEYPPGVAAPGTAPYDPYDANSPWFDPVLVLQRVGVLPSDLGGCVQKGPEPHAGTPTAECFRDQGPAVAADANVGVPHEPEPAGHPMPTDCPLVPGSARDRLVVFGRSDSTRDRLADSADDQADDDVVRSVPFGPFEAFLAIGGVVAAIAKEGLAASLAALTRLIGKYMLRNTRSADVDQAARDAKESFEQRRADALDPSHLSAAEGDLRGQFIMNPASGRIYDHLREVREAQRGLRNDINELAKKVRHYQRHVRLRPGVSIDDANHLLREMRAFLKYTEDRVPPSAKPPSGPKR